MMRYSLNSGRRSPSSSGRKMDGIRAPPPTRAPSRSAFNSLSKENLQESVLNQCPQTEALMASSSSSVLPSSTKGSRTIGSRLVLPPADLVWIPDKPCATKKAECEENGKDGDKDTDSLTVILEQAVASMSEDRADESQLAKLLLRAEEEGNVTVEDALAAAVQDVISLQKTLFHLEQGGPNDDDMTKSHSTRQYRVSPISTLSDFQDEDTKYAQVVQDLQDTRDKLEVALKKHAKLAAANRQKKTLLVTATAKNQQLLEQIDRQRKEHASLTHQNARIQGGLQTVSAVRDDLRNKLRVQKELLKETRALQEEAERNLRQSEKERALERQLLDLYRELAVTTGYQKMGKRIRMLEAELAAAVSQEK